MIKAVRSILLSYLNSETKLLSRDTYVYVSNFWSAAKDYNKIKRRKESVGTPPFMQIFGAIRAISKIYTFMQIFSLLFLCDRNETSRTRGHTLTRFSPSN